MSSEVSALGDVREEVQALKAALDATGEPYLVCSDTPERGALAKLTSLRDRLRARLARTGVNSRSSEAIREMA